MSATFFENLKQYVGFTEESSAALRALHPIAAPWFVPIVDDFYDAIRAHPEARNAITGGQAQIDRLKRTLIEWLEGLLTGPHDEAYFERRARIGRVHVRIALPQEYMFTAVDRIRLRLLDVLDRAPSLGPAATHRMAAAVHQILDLELAIMLETYREDLVRKNRNAERLTTIGQLGASIGHELRNPLGVMESSLFLLRQHLPPEAARAPNVAKHLDRIGGEIKRANRTIQNLLDLARYRPPRRAVHELRALLTDAARLAQVPDEVACLLDGVPQGLTVDVDADQLRQVLINLFTNAAQAMTSGGTIGVEAETRPSGETRVRVHDDGPGIPADVRHRVFEPLFTTKAKGSGLGLALCRQILEAHGGSIQLEPTSSGASFVLVLPPSTPVPATEATAP